MNPSGQRPPPRAGQQQEGVTGADKAAAATTSIIAAADSAPGSEPRYVFDLSPSDVLMGRGAPTIAFTGT
jgi:hypothetical protein